MSGFRLSREAFEDIDSLWLYIAEDNVAAADRVVEAILEACSLLAEHPRIGHLQPDLTDRPYLFWISGKYQIVYRAESDPLDIVAVFHSARDVAALLTDRD